MEVSTVFFVLSLVAVVVLGPIVIGVVYSLSKRRAISNQELKTLQNEIAQIKGDIADIKEQIADFIIKTH
jgi:cell division protein FtsB